MPRGIRARYVGQCSVCGAVFEKRTRVALWGKDWVHLECWEYAHNAARVNGGETFAGTALEYRRRVSRRD